MSAIVPPARPTGSPTVTADRLQAFLQAEMPTASQISVVDVAPVSSIGNARQPWSFSVSWRHADGGSRTERCVMLVKAAAGQLETSLATEFATIRALAGSGVPVPRALWLDESGDWLGQPFFVTGFVEGTASMRPLRIEGGTPEMSAVARALARATAALHDVDWSTLDPGGRMSHGPDDVAGAQLTLWRERFERQRLEPHPGLVWAFEWLGRHLPTASRLAIVHGDLRFGNLLYAGDRLTALLDWEMTHLGDPVEDLGWVYRSLWSPERSLSFDAFLACYEAESGAAVNRDHLRWYQAFSEVKHSVISLTAARSFHDGLTRNLRHADRASTVPAFLHRFSQLVPAP